MGTVRCNSLAGVGLALVSGIEAKIRDFRGPFFVDRLAGWDMTSLRPHSAWIARARRNLVWLLVAVYVLAAVVPAAGHALRALSLGTLPFSGGEFNLTHLLLAVMLLCVGIAIRPHDVDGWRPLTVAVGRGLLGSWLLPIMALLLLLGVGSVFSPGPVATAFVAGAILVVAMPPANSASAWSELSGGQSAATLWIIILATLVSPLVTPAVVRTVADVASLPSLAAAQSSGSLLEVLVAFVMLPAALGLVTRTLLDAVRSEWTDVVLEWSRGIALLSLLLLNYINAAAALPLLVSSSLAAAGVGGLTLLLCAMVFGLGIAAGRWLGLREACERLCFAYVVGMKNTGAALVLASTLLADQPLALLVPVLYTLAQHLAAALLSRWTTSEQSAEPVVVMESLGPTFDAGPERLPQETEARSRLSGSRIAG